METWTLAKTNQAGAQAESFCEEAKENITLYITNRSITEPVDVLFD